MAIYPYLGLLTMGGTIQGPVDGPPEDPPPPDDPPPTPGWSLTGRDPLFLSEAQVDVWIQMKNENHPWYQKILADATSSTGYGDDGTAKAWMYQVTGDTSYASGAWGELYNGPWSNMTQTRSTLGPNTVRESFITRALLLDMLWPWLDATKRTQAVNHMAELVAFSLADGTPTNKGGMSTADSDQLTGSYFGLMLWNGFNEPENTLYGTLTNRVCVSTGINMGGFASTGTSGSYRNVITKYVTQYAAGGEWIESSEYNMGTLRLLMMGYSGCRNAYGTDHFPEITAWLPSAARWAVAEITPDLLAMNQWADEQNPDAFVSRMWSSWSTLVQFAALNASDTTGGHFCSTLTHTLATLYPTQTFNALCKRAFFLINPYVPQRDISEFPQATEATGIGHLAVRQGNDLAVLLAPAKTTVHHGLNQNASFKLYRNGKWALDHPLGYALYFTEASQTVNTLLFAGLNYPMSTAQRVSSVVGTDYWTQTFKTSGGYYSAGSYNPPPAFVTGDQLRRIVYWRDVATGYDIFVIRDDTNAVNPQGLTNFSRYTAKDQALINAAITRTGGSVKEWKIHTQVAPTFDAGTGIWSWPIPGGVDTGYVAPFSPVLTGTVYNETTLGWPTGIRASEQKYQLRLHPSTVQAIDTFLVVVMVGTSARPAINYTDVNTVEIGGRTCTFSGTSATVS